MVACGLHRCRYTHLVGGRVMYFIALWLLGVPLGLLALFWLLGIFN